MALREEGYWEEHYEQELKKYIEDGDEGEVWFGKGLNRKIVDWILARLSNQSDSSAEQAIQVIDIGCGNAFLLCSLLEKSIDKKSFPSISALGIDYSANSISLSAKIVQDRNLQDRIELKECDFLEETQVSSIGTERKFDYIIDKGTYDAICLLHSQSEEKLTQTRAAYLKSISKLSKPGSVFILASCNHTEEELLKLFESDDEFKRQTKLVDKIETPSIQFGGKSGSQVACLIIEFST